MFVYGSNEAVSQMDPELKRLLAAKLQVSANNVQRSVSWRKFFLLPHFAFDPNVALQPR